GGEQNRLILARLFSKPANLIVLDEPTNDLDMETLELLEEILLDFTGTILLVSHDRSFLDNVVTSSICFEGNGVVKENVGGYQVWLNQGGRLMSFSEQDKVQEQPPAKKTTPTVENTAARKDSYKEQRELEQIPKEIEKLEEKISAIEQDVAAEGFYSQPQEVIDKRLAELAAQQERLDTLYARWEELLAE